MWSSAMVHYVENVQSRKKTFINLATPLVQSLQQWTVTVIPGSGSPPSVDTLQIDFIHSASAIGMWTV